MPLSGMKTVLESLVWVPVTTKFKFLFLHRNELKINFSNKQRREHKQDTELNSQFRDEFLHKVHGNDVT